MDPNSEHFEAIGRHYDSASTHLLPGATNYRAILAHYYKLLIPADASVLEVGCGAGDLLAMLPNQDVTGVDLSGKQLAAARQKVPRGKFYQCAAELLSLNRTFDYIIISETINFAADVQAILQGLHSVSTSETRLAINFYNSVWRPLLGAARAFGLQANHPLRNWLSTDDVVNLLQLSDWDVIKVQPRILLPIRIPLLERIFNAYLAPLLPPLCLTVFVTARPHRSRIPQVPKSVSVVIPARNEAGTMEEAVLRTPEMGSGTEIIFVEGNSTDNTWEEIQRVQKAHPERKIRILQQTGRGKGNAVRDGFAVATGEILMILDADLTVPPEDLPKFYDAVASGHAEFANGVRLVYPMRDGAMRFANMCANKGFSILFTYLLGQAIKDTLCGTKVISKKNYERLVANRNYFGDFDPFGDFDLLFGADKLNLKICDIPIRYRERVYGETNIQRWRSGVLLLQMVLFAARKLKFI